tara:strand:+ start:90 stop:1538 length:1449 start_codon:yes stop_codon:yes gene_type:complete
MSEEILVNVSPILTRVARVVDGQLIDFAIEPTSRHSPVGNIYLGQTLSVVPALRAAFVDVGLERDGFLSADDARELGGDIGDDGILPPINQLLREGDSILVQVARDAFGDKGARLTTTISLPGRTLIYSPYRTGVALSRRIVDEGERDRLTGIVNGLLEEDEGVIVRTNAEGAQLKEFSDELDALREVWRTVLRKADKLDAPSTVHADLGAVARAIRDYVSSPYTKLLIDNADTLSSAKSYAATAMPALAERMSLHVGSGSLFDRHDVEDQVADILEPSVDLPGGGRITIETTVALTAIDVDSKGRNRGNPEEVALQTNLAAAKEISRQLRLRGIGGVIVVDFIQMRRNVNAERVVEVLREELRDDPATTDIGGLSRFGILEMTRRRVGPPLVELISQTCPTCVGRGQIDTPETTADHALATAEREVEENPGGDLTIVAAPKVITVIEGVANARALSLRLGCNVTLRRDEKMLLDHFDVIRA